MEVLIFILWLIFAVLVGLAANARGRNGFGWFLLAVVISPLLAILFLLAVAAKPKGPTKICQFCRTTISRDATVCPQCTRDIDTVEQIKERENKIASQRAVLGACLVVALAAAWIINSLAVKTPATAPVTAERDQKGASHRGTGADGLTDDDRATIHAGRQQVLAQDNECRRIEKGGRTAADSYYEYYLTCIKENGDRYNRYFDKKEVVGR